jgi:hypothetical protein
MPTHPSRLLSPPEHPRALALDAARRRLAMLKVGTLGAGIVAFGVLTAGIAGQTGASASGGSAQPAGRTSTLDGGQRGAVAPASGSGNANDDGGSANPGVVNPAPGIVSAQS